MAQPGFEDVVKAMASGTNTPGETESKMCGDTLAEHSDGVKIPGP